MPRESSKLVCWEHRKRNQLSRCKRCSFGQCAGTRLYLAEYTGPTSEPVVIHVHHRQILELLEALLIRLGKTRWDPIYRSIPVISENEF